MLATEISIEINAIGEDAGRIFEYISDKGDCTMAALKKDLKMTGDSAALALGWLAREGRIDMRRKGTSTRIYIV
ncbi:MAG: winged helix-turn-helix domain-containing protein [Candidatus Gastranaerophilales bacterium]|nr:winged helix-turn-helix domain-containing protein [Candidatus Gastranaerophilales bacterium]